jgi:hypothetical protein
MKKKKQEDKSSKTGQSDMLDNIINSPTERARSNRSSDTFSNQGTNISYEGATAPGSGGSVDTGDSSGKPADNARISSSDENDYIKSSGKSVEEEIKMRDNGDELDRGFTGTP